jgi:hypothetical protein
MVEPLRHRQTKGAATDMFYLTPPRHISTLPSPCENAKTLDRDRTSYSFNAALGAQAASSFTFEIEPENIILVALRVFEFSHSLGQERTNSNLAAVGANAQARNAAFHSWRPVLADQCQSQRAASRGSGSG